MRMAIERDIYFDPRYARVSALLESGTSDSFVFKHSLGTVRHQYIVRPIESGLAEGGPYFDITTPYGYGGPLIVECKTDRREILVHAFMEAFGLHCAQNNIVSEFVRFHPIADNARDFAPFYDASFHNYTVGTNLVDFGDPFANEYSKSCRRDVRKAMRDGLSFEIEEYPDTLEDFRLMYIHTMERIQASPYYFFREEYFDALVKEMPEMILKGIVRYDNRAIGMGLFLRAGDLLHDHLSASLTEFLSLAPTYMLLHGLMRWGMEHGMKLIHYGGGTSSSEEDSLYLFKKQFGRNTRFSFFTGRRVWNHEVYEQLAAGAANNDGGYFPLYRAGM